MASPVSTCTESYPETEIQIEIESSPCGPQYLRPAVAAIVTSSSAVAASTSANPHRNPNIYYDVFIGHRGPDVHKTLASHLYRRLLSHGLQVFLYPSELQEGENLPSEIEDAIKTASVNVPILSCTYAASTWCLKELLLMLELQAPIIPVFFDVKRDDLRWMQSKDGVYAKAVRSLEIKQTDEGEPLYDSNTIKKWREALCRVEEISGFDLDAYNGDEGELIDQVVECVLEKLKKPIFNVAKYPTGLLEKVSDFENTVLLQKQQRRKVQVVGIVGLGGVGKTTLAKELFHRKRSDYSKSCFLFDVRENARKGSLHSLQRKLLNGLTHSDIHIDSVNEGIQILIKELTSSNAFIVLDDVDHANQLDAFLPVQSVLRSDSLILITSRDSKVLIDSRVGEKSIYELTGLNAQQSRELFCSHALSQPYPLPGYGYVVNKFIKACGGLPLSLKVLGALLNGRKDLSYWEAILDRLEKALPSDIRMNLKISFDTLHQEEQKIFLDIACFFIGEEKHTAIRIWDGSGWGGSLGFQHLQDRCLVEVIENKITMHEELRDLGREIAEASELSCRIWRWTQNIDDLFQQQAITEVRGIRMRRDDNTDGAENSSQMSCYKRWSHQLLRHRWMTLCNKTSYRVIGTGKLQLLDTAGYLLERTFRRARPPNLIWLSWYNCPYSSLPSWIPLKNLRVLKVEGAKLKSLWSSGYQAPLQLRELVIDSPLSKIPESIGRLKHLEKIVLRKSNLKTLPDEFCHLLSLKRFELTNCPNLKSLPDYIGYLINLVHIDLSHSSHLHMLPNSLGNLLNLKYIGLSHSLQLQMLPGSFGNLIRLKYLYLRGCSNLSISPQTLGNIRTLECLDLSYCNKMEILPPQVAKQMYLKKLNLRGTNIKQMPDEIGNLSCLEVLEVGSPSLESLPPSLGHLRILKELRLENCTKLKQLPASVGLLPQLTELRVLNCPLQTLKTLKNLESARDNWMPRLRDLELHNTKLSEVLFAAGVCPILQYFSIRVCNDLVEVGALPSALVKLELTDCSNLRKIEGLCGLAKLQMLDISWCINLEELPSVEMLVSLKELQAKACVKLKSIQGLAQLTEFRLLNVQDCSELKGLPGIQQCTSLEYLHAKGCPKQWAEGGVLEQLQELKVVVEM